MGLLDIFKKKNKNEETITNTMDIQPKVPFKRSGDLESGLVIDYYDPNSSFKKLYDTICLYVGDTNPCYEERGNKVYNAYVSWYGNSDCEYYDEKGKVHNFRREEVVPIQVGLDSSKLESGKEDLEYMKALFTQLLDQNRVKEYIDRGLQENPKNPCGKYIGEIFYDYGKNAYKKGFMPQIGMKSHFSEQQVKERKQYRLEKEKAKMAQIAQKREEMERLQSEIDKLNGDER